MFNYFNNRIFSSSLNIYSNFFLNKLNYQNLNLGSQPLFQNFKLSLKQSRLNNGELKIIQKQSFEQKFEFQKQNYYKYWISGIIPFFLIIDEQRRKREQANCILGFGKSSNYKRNRIVGRIATAEYNANDPIEDRHHCKQLKNLDAFVCTVFDGHGGWALSEYANSQFINELDFQLEQLKKKNKYANEDEYIIDALNKTFEFIENSFYDIALAGKIPKPFNTGSCALVALVKDNKVYSANIGDCKGVLISEEGKEYKARKINHKLNANSPKEQKRLRNDFPNDKDIFICKKPDNTVCYVKGRLMPTRAFGDYHLKFKEHFKGKGEYNGPYITAKPQIIIHELKQNDKYLVLACDGLWDELNSKQIAQVTYDNKDEKSKVVSGLINSALQTAATNAKMTVKELSEIPDGQRRSYHDDITIICVDLDNQYKK